LEAVLEKELGGFNAVLAKNGRGAVVVRGRGVSE
jgi:hypothetical protein